MSNYDGCNIIQLRKKCVSNFTFINLKIFLWEKFNFCRVVVKWLKEIDANNLSLSEKCHENPIEESEKCPSWKVIKQLCDILRLGCWHKHMHTENNGPESGIQPHWERLVPAYSRHPHAPQPPSLNASLQKLHQVLRSNSEPVIQMI